jgi:membrane-bound lytic murein transglycosylase D
MIMGCSAILKRDTLPVTETTVPAQAEQEIAVPEMTVDVEEPATESEHPFSPEEDLLARILTLYHEAREARDEEDFGFAEAKLDSAAMLSATIEPDTLSDPELADEFRRALSGLYIEYGQILTESEKIAREDPATLLDEFSHADIEQFRNGEWDDDELMKIVRRIALRTDVPIAYNEKVKRAILYFQNNKNGRKAMALWIKRGGRFIPFIQQILEEEGVPKDLVYLSMIESGFSVRAYSRARAVGLWQFIYATGRLYGLKRDQWIDERRDPVKSTRAAARHLKDLYNMYNDWYLVMAAYNCGPSRITRQVNKDKEIEYWEMNLPRETQNYVPYFMAAVVISKAPELFGFDGIELESPLTYEEAEVHPYTSLATAAKCIGITTAELTALNGELRQKRTPAGKEKYMLKIPAGTREKFVVAYANIPEETYSPPSVDTYRVRRGDTLSGIARKHGVSLNKLMLANSGIIPTRLRVGQVVRIPGAGGSTASTRTPSSTAVADASGRAVTYRVRSGDTLSGIADRHGTSVGILQAINSMGRSTRIYRGQNIKVPGRVTASSQTAAAQSNTSSTSTVNATLSNGFKNITYVIQKNDTLYEIAQKYKVDHRDIMRWNQIKNHRRIKPGDRITIITPE